MQESITKNIIVNICITTSSYKNIEVDSQCIIYKKLFVNVIINN